MKDHEQLFNEYKEIKTKLDNLAGIFQNDFDLLLRDRHVTKAEIESSRVDLDLKTHDVIKTLMALRDRGYKILEKASK